MNELTAILLCGGKGERLKPFTDVLPKALVPLGEQPLLYHLLRYLSSEGVSRFIVCTGYKAEAIESFLRESADPAWKIICVNSGEVSMTDRILAASKHVKGDVLICYGDTLANLSMGDLRASHRASGALATLTIYPLHSPFGIVHFDEENCVSAFVEKPTLPYWINIGFILCEPEAFSHLKAGSDMPVFLSSLAESGALHAYRHTGKHLTVNTEKERAEAEVAMVEFFTYMDGHNL